LYFWKWRHINGKRTRKVKVLNFKSRQGNAPNESHERQNETQTKERQLKHGKSLGRGKKTLLE